jgi:predicted RNase H-like nuclease
LSKTFPLRQVKAVGVKIIQGRVLSSRWRPGPRSVLRQMSNFRLGPPAAYVTRVLGGPRVGKNLHAILSRTRKHDAWLRSSGMKIDFFRRIGHSQPVLIFWVQAKL